MLAWTAPGIAAGLLAVMKACPVANFAIEGDQCEIAQAFGALLTLEALYEILL